MHIPSYSICPRYFSPHSNILEGEMSLLEASFEWDFSVLDRRATLVIFEDVASLPFFGPFWIKRHRRTFKDKCLPSDVVWERVKFLASLWFKANGLFLGIRQEIFAGVIGVSWCNFCLIPLFVPFL